MLDKNTDYGGVYAVAITGLVITFWWLFTQGQQAQLSERLVGSLGAGFGLPLLALFILAIVKLFTRQPVTPAFKKLSPTLAVVMLLLLFGAYYDTVG